MKSGLLWGERLVLLALLGLVGCSSPSGSPAKGPLVELGIDDGASAGQKKSGRASVQEGVTVALENGASVAVPKGAVEKDLDIGIERPADAEAIKFVEHLDKGSDGKGEKTSEKVASAPYVVTPHGAKFKEDVEITLPVSDKSKG